MESERHLPDSLCALYRRANLCFPQVEVGIVPMVGDAMLQCGPALLSDLLTLDFSTEQIAFIRQGMDRSHGAYQIPALSPSAIASWKGNAEAALADHMDRVREISDERIRVVWRNIVIYTIDAMVDCVRAIRPAAPLPNSGTADDYCELAQALPKLFGEDPSLFADVAAIFGTSVRALESPDAQRLAREFRDCLDFSDIQSGRQALVTARRVLHAFLSELMLRFMREEHPGFAGQIESRTWQIFRPFTSA